MKTYVHRVTGVRYGMSPLFAKDPDLKLVEIPEPDQVPDPVPDPELGEIVPSIPKRRRRSRNDVG